jgi:ribosome recycling factor
MQEEIDMVMDILNESMDSKLEHLNKELNKIRTGKASPSMLTGVMVDYYGSPTPLNQVANVSASDSKTLSIQPWEKGMLGPIEKAIFEANLGFTPMNDGEMVRIVLPPLTEERRRDLVKMAKASGEDTKVSMRSARQKAMDAVKSAVKNGYSEDAGKKVETDIQNTINSYTKRVDDSIQTKEKDIMTV